MDIYGTIGPACLSVATLKDMFENGMTGIRLNLSHITLREAEDMIRIYHEAAAQAGVAEPKLLIDMQGPEIRVGKMDDMILENGQEVALGEDGIPVPELILPYVKEGQKILLDDGKILIQALADGIHCVVLRGGVLKGRKSIALEDCYVPTPTLTEQDLENLKDAKAYGVTGIMQPFVRSKEDLLKVRSSMEEAGCGDLALFAKIENMNGVEHLEDFFEVSDEIVIARGDLGNAMPLWKLPGVQKKIAQACKKADMPFMVVTQMLASMEERPVPTRAEVSDIYNAVMDGCSSVMVTGETAVGKYPVDVIRYLTNTAMEALTDYECQR